MIYWIYLGCGLKHTAINIDSTVLKIQIVIETMEMDKIVLENCQLPLLIDDLASQIHILILAYSLFLQTLTFPPFISIYTATIVQLTSSYLH